MLAAAECLFEDFKNKKDIISTIKDVSLARNTVARRIEDLSENIVTQLNHDIQICTYFSLQFDESTDITDHAQVMVFIKMIFDDYTTKESLLSTLTLSGKTRGIDLYEAFKKLIHEEMIPLQKLVAITTDGAPSMVGKNNGFIALCENDKEIPNFKKYHCVIHQQNLCGKILKYSPVMNVVVKIVNSIRGRALQHRLFKSLLDELDAAHGELIFHSEVRWLSRGKVLNRFLDLLPEIKIFLQSKEEIYNEFDDILWMTNLAFLTDITTHLNELNLTLQGKDKDILIMLSAINAFKCKLDLWCSQLRVHNFQHFPSIIKILGDDNKNYELQQHINDLSLLKAEFNRRFQDLMGIEPVLLFLANPFLTFDASNLSLLMEQFTFVNKIDVEMEIITFQNDIRLKSIDNVDGSLWKIVDSSIYPNIMKCAYKLKTFFGSSYLCELAFSQMNVIKDKHRNRLSDKHLRDCMTLAVSPYVPDFKKLSSNVQSQVSH